MRPRTVRRALLTSFGAATLLATPAGLRAQVPAGSGTRVQAPTDSVVNEHDNDPVDYRTIGLGAGVIVVGGAALYAVRRRRAAEAAPRTPGPRPPTPPRAGTERDTMR